MPTWVEKMYWDCHACETKHIDGLNDHCPQCGSAHDTKESPWYADQPGSYANRITDTRELELAHAGPNWKCTFCQGTDRNEDGNCLNCGASRVDGVVEGTVDRVPEPLPEPTSTWDVTITGDPTPKRKPRTQATTFSTRSIQPDPFFEDADDFNPKKDLKKKLYLLLWVMVGVTVLSLIGWWLFHKRPVTVRVESVEWRQSVTIERKELVKEQGFDEDQPARDESAKLTGKLDRVFDIRVVDHHRYHHTDQVEDGTEPEEYTEREACGTETTPVTHSTNNNGTITYSGGDSVTKYCNVTKTRQVKKYKDVKRYEPYYSWYEWRWKTNRTVDHKGTTTQTSWPTDREICLRCQTSGLEDERIEKKEGSYLVHFKEEDTNTTYKLQPDTAEDFTRYPIESTHQCLDSIIGGIDCDTIHD